MPNGTLHYRLRIRTATDEADLFVATSLRDGINPFIESPPEGDGSSLDPLTGKVTVGAYTVKVIDAPGVILNPTGGTISDGWEYANIGAAQAAGWSFIDTMTDGVTTVGAADQVHGGTKSLKFAVTGNNRYDFSGHQMSATKVYDSGDGIAANTAYTVSVWVRANARQWYDRNSQLVVNGVAANFAGAANAWTQISVTANSSATAELSVTLKRTNPFFISKTSTVWFDDLSIQGLAPGTTLEGRVVTSVLADLDGQQQLMSKPAIVEESEDEGEAWTTLARGYVNRAAMTDALLWEFTVGDSKRVEQSRRVFYEISDPIEHPLFIGTLDRASCLMGGPIVGDWGAIYKDRGRPAFEVLDVFDNNVLNVGWTNDGGSLHAIYKEDGPPMRDHVAEFINDSAREYVDPDVILAQVSLLQFAIAPDLVCRIYDYDTSDWVADVPCVLRRIAGFGSGTEDWGLVSQAGHFSIQWDGASPGDKYRFAVFPRTTSDRNPMHWSGHPMDLVANVLDFIGTPYSLTSLQAMGEELGLDLKIHLRITSGETAQTFLENTVYGLFGVAPRLNDDGEVEFVRSRSPDTVSSGTVSIADVAGELTGNPWQVDEASAANLVIVETHAYIPDTRRPDSGTPFDAIRDATITCNIKPPNGSEGAVFGDKEIRFTLPGSIQVGSYILKAGKPKQESGVDVTPAGTLDVWCANVAQPIFDWQGRGAIRADLDLRRGVTDANIGDVLTLDLEYFPSANPDQSPVSQRGTDPRRAVVLRRTKKPDRVSLLLEDRGLAAELECDPEFTLDPSATFPKTTVTVEVTNETDLASALRVEMAQGASEPAGAGQFVRLFHPNRDANPFDLPPVCAGNTVWVRMRCENAGQIGTWSAWQSIDLADLTAPSSLSAVVTNTTIALSWTNGETTYPVEILARLDTDTTLQSVAVLPAGSTSYTLLLTQASTDYVIGVRYIDPKGCTSTTVTVSTATDTDICLDPPVNLAAFADGAGTYGVELDALTVPGGVDIWVATETAVGSGTPGTYTLADSVPALAPPLRTRWTAASPVPNDGLLRYIKAESSQAGYTACGFSAVVSINPWTLVEPTDPGDPDEVPDDGAGLITTVFPVPLLTVPFVLFQPGADRAAVTVYRHAEDKPVLDGATACRLTAQIVATELPIDAYLAAEFEPVSGEWATIEDDTADATLDGPRLAIDSASLDALDPNADESAWNVAGEWVPLRVEAQADVRVRLVVGGGDETGAAILGKVTLWVQLGPRVVLPPEIDDPAPEDPGSCDVAGDFDAFAYTDQATAFAAWPED